MDGHVVVAGIRGADLPPVAQRVQQLGGARAAEHLRLMAVELQMVPVRAGVHIGGSDFFRVSAYNPNPEPMSALDGVLAGSVKDMLDQVAWYARVLKPAREAVQQAA